MRFQFSMRLIAAGLIAAAGLMLLSLKPDGRFAQAQAAATPTPRSAVNPITYTVKTGDSFNVIARQFNLTPEQLQALNGITNTGVIRVGQVLIVSSSTFTPTSASTNTSTPTSTATPTPTDTPTPAPTSTPTAEPTATPTDVPVSTDQPFVTPVPAPITPSAPAGLPLDVILVGVIMFLAVIGIIIGFRTQRY